MPGHDGCELCIDYKSFQTNMDGLSRNGYGGNGNLKTRNRYRVIIELWKCDTGHMYVPARHSQASLVGPGQRQRRTCPSARRSFCNGSAVLMIKHCQRHNGPRVLSL